MNFEVDRYSSAWAHIALCANLTWATEPPDDFIIANQRLWTQHCRVSQALQDTLPVETQNLQIVNQCEISDSCRNSNQNQDNSSCSSRSVKDVIPESRLAQFYGNFYYDEVRESCYTNANEKSQSRSCNGQGCENSDLTECWMLPEVEFWYRKLLDENPERSTTMARRRRQFRMLASDDDFKFNGHRSAASERWGLCGARSGDEEAALAARVDSVRGLWSSRAPRAPSPPPPPRKIRARRRQPRRLAVLGPPPPTYCLDAPAQLMCDPSCKFETPRPPQPMGCQRAMGRLSASVQALMRASAARCPPYRGTNVSRYAPTSQRPGRCPDRRYGVWWPKDHPAPRLDHKFHLHHKTTTIKQAETSKREPEESKGDNSTSNQESETIEQETEPSDIPEIAQQPEENTESPRSTQKEKEIVDDQLPSTSAAAIDQGLKKRLYSTVLSMNAPAPINITAAGCIRLSQKLVPGLLKLNPKIVMPAARIRPQQSDNKFEELEKEALEQYKASDESIDTKFRELEKQAVEQYSTSNSNTSCSSGNSSEKKTSSSPSIPENEPKDSKSHAAKFHKEKAVDSVVVYSQNFPDLNSKAQTKNLNLKNFHTPPRGEKKEQSHRSGSKSSRSSKSYSQKAASDTDYESREVRDSHKGSTRWTLHVIPPKKRHLTLCVSDFSSDEDREDAAASFKDAGSCMRSKASGKMKMSAHGGGDLIMRKT